MAYSKCENQLLFISFLCKIRLAPGFSVFVGIIQHWQVSRKDRILAVDGSWLQYIVGWEEEENVGNSEVKEKILTSVPGENL